MTDSNGEFIIDRRKAIAGLGMAGVGVTTGLSFASDEDSTSEDISVEVDGGGVVDVATAESASEGGLGIEYGEVATESGGGVTGFAGDKSEAVLVHPPYEGNGEVSDTDEYNDRVLYGAVLENPNEVNQFLDFTVTIGNVGEVANGDPFDFLTLELQLEAVKDDDDGSYDDPLDIAGNEDADELTDPDSDLGDSDPVNDPVEDKEDDNEVATSNEASATVSLTNPRARLRTRPAEDFSNDDLFENGDDEEFGGYRVIVTGGTASVRNIAGEERTFDPGSDFDVDFNFSIE